MKAKSISLLLKVLKMLKIFAFALTLIAFKHSALAQDPLFETQTITTTTTDTEPVYKGTPCYTTTGDPLTECRRKRGIVEKPLILFDFNQEEDVAPTQVLTIETTRAPRSWKPRSDLDQPISSSKEEVYNNSYKIFRQLASMAVLARAEEASFTFLCGGPLNFSEFLHCLGFNVQDTTTTTITFSSRRTITAGYSAMTLAGCLPPLFPYISCP